MKINHIGIAVKKIEESIGIYTTLLGKGSVQFEGVPGDSVRVAFVQIGGSRIELLEPISPASPVHKFIERYGEGIHHIAIEVRDINKAIHTLKSRGVRMIDDTPRKGAHDMLIAFVHPESANGVLLELCQQE